MEATGEIGRNDEERDCKAPSPLSLNRQQHRHGKGKLHFSKSVKRRKGPLGQSVSTNFVVDCSFLILKPLPYVKAWMSAPYPPHHHNHVILLPLRPASLMHKNPQRRTIVHDVHPVGRKDRSCNFCDSYFFSPLLCFKIEGLYFNFSAL